MPVTPKLGLELFAPLGVGWREDATAGALLDYNMMLLDAASGGGGSSVSINGTLVADPNFKDSATVTFAVSGHDVTATAAAPILPVTTARTAHSFFTTYTASTGVFGQAQPSAADLSDSAASAGNVLRANGTSFVAAQLAFDDTSGTVGLARGGTNADLSATGGANAFLAQAADHSISARQPAYTDITGLSTVAHTGAWSDLQDATGALTLANGANATTFNQTSAAKWTWANTTAAIHLTSQSSPILNLNGTVYNGATSIADSWTIQNVVGNTDNGLSDLEFTHSGSSGIAILGISNGTDRVSLGSHSVSSGFPAIWLGIAAGSETLSNYSLLKVATGKTAINDVANVSVRINNSDKAIISGTVFELVSGMTLQIGGVDTGISRLGAASLAVGNGSAGDFTGSLKLTGENNQGGYIVHRVTKAAGYTATAADYVMSFTATATLVLDSAAAVSGTTYRVKLSASATAGSVLTIAPNNSKTIDGSATLVMVTLGSSVDVVYDSVTNDWQIF